MKKKFLRNVLCVVMSVAMVLGQTDLLRAAEESVSDVSEAYLQEAKEIQTAPEQEEREKGQIVPESKGNPEEQTVSEPEGSLEEQAVSELEESLKEQTVSEQEEMLESVVISDSEAVVEASGHMAEENADKMISPQEEDGSLSLANEAVAIQLDRNYTGNILAASVCVYKFTLSQSGTLNINSRSADADSLYYVLYDADEKRIAYTDTEYNSTTGLNSADIDWVLTSGTYYLIFARNYDSYKDIVYMGKTGSFNFKLSLDATGESFREGNGGSNNSFTTASNILLGKTYTAQIAKNDDTDYFKFTLENPSEVTISVISLITSNPGGNIHYQVYGFDGAEILQWPYLGLGRGDKSSFHLTKGTYYLKFSTGMSIYKFNLTAKTVSETFPDVNGGSNNTLMEANKISLGKSYYGQIAENDRVDYFQFTIAETKKMNLSVYSEEGLRCIIYDFNGNQKWEQFNHGGGEVFITELPKGIYYLGIQGDRGTYSFQLSSYQPDSAQISNIENTAKGVKLTWNSVSGATGYKIYRRQGKGSYKLIKTVKKGNATSYTDKKASNKKQYTYKLKTIENSYSSVYSTTKTIYCMKTKAAVKKLSKATGGFTVSLKKVSGATGYEIQYSTSQTFSYSVYSKTTKKRTLKISAYSSPYYKYTYYVRVRAYKKVGKKKYYAPWGAKKKVTI